MRFNERSPILTVAIIFGGLFCIFTVVSFFPLIFPFLDQSWWDDFSTVTDIIGMLGYLMAFLSLMTGRNDAEIERILDRYELRKKAKESDSMQQSSTEEEYQDTVNEFNIIINTLRSSSLSNNISEFESIKTLLSNSQITDAVIRTRRAIEVLFKDLLARSGVIMEGRRTSARWLIDRAVEHRLLTGIERDLILDFLFVANQVVHGDLKAEDLVLAEFFEGIAVTIKDAVMNYEGQSK